MTKVAKCVGAVVLVLLTLAGLIALVAVLLPSPTAAERAAFDRWQAGQANHAREIGGGGKE